MATLNISLPDIMKEFVETEVVTGGYNTTSEYFRTLVREAQERKAKARLEALLLEGSNSNDISPMTEADWEDVRRDIRERVTRRKLDELRRDVKHGFDQIERGEFTEYTSGKEVADRIIAEGLKRIAERKKVEA